MAAHDDKISSNRRRLFKALSAAPVVMTLRPGTAAASSAYQCLTTAYEDAGIGGTFNPGPVTAAEANASFYKYVGPLDYWVMPETLPGGDACASVVLPDTTFIVLRDNVYYDDKGLAIVIPLPFTHNLTNNELRFPPEPEPQCVGVPRTTGGYFAIVGNATQEDTFFTETGVFPVNNGGDQGITGTCMSSLVGAGRYVSLNP